MSVLTDLIYGGSHAVAGLTEGAVNDAIAKYGADHPIAFPDTAYFFPTIYAATGVKVKTLGDLPACVGVLKSLITDQEDLGQALNAGLATAVGAEILEGLKFAEPKDAYEQAAVPGIGFVPDPVIRSLGVPLVTGDIPGVAVVLGKAENGEDVAKVVKDYQSKGIMTFMVGEVIEQCAEAGVKMGLELRGPAQVHQGARSRVRQYLRCDRQCRRFRGRRRNRAGLPGRGRYRPRRKSGSGRTGVLHRP